MCVFLIALVSLPLTRPVPVAVQEKKTKSEERECRVAVLREAILLLEQTLKTESPLKTHAEMPRPSLGFHGSGAVADHKAKSTYRYCTLPSGAGQRRSVPSRGSMPAGF